MLKAMWNKVGLAAHASGCAADAAEDFAAASVAAETETAAEDDGYLTDRSEGSITPAHQVLALDTDLTDDAAFDAATRAAIAASLQEMATAKAVLVQVAQVCQVDF